MPSVDLWPQDIGSTTMRTPLAILKEQASLLGTKTRNLLVAEVRTRRDPEGDFLLQFDLVAPALDHYRYQLFRLNQPVDLYPLSVGDDPLGLGVKRQLKSEEDLHQFLREIFNSERTRRIISALVSQSTAA